MPGNLRLLLYGLVLGLLSTVYPLLPAYLPRSVTDRLPFLPPHSLNSPSGQRWTGTWHRYQSQVPIAPGHQHSREADWEAEIEQQLRFGDKNGGREIEKEMKRQLREVEKRAEHAGAENGLKDVLPVYFLEQGSSADALVQVGREIDLFEPKTILLLSTHKTTASHLLVSTSSAVSSAKEPSISFPSSSKLAQSLLNTFAHHGKRGVPAAGSQLASLTPAAAKILPALHLHPETEVVQVLLPVIDKEQGGWDAESWWNVGAALHELLHEKESGSGGKRPKHRGVLVLAIGLASPKNPSASFPSLLDSALAHHTSHARELSLLSLYSSLGGAKPRKAIREGLVGLFTAVAAAGEAEGEQLPARAGWRFGHLPVR
ncbi:hypothetical protein JCM11641_008278 [Rhodosporidiobolus odoratus]